MRLWRWLIGGNYNSRVVALHLWNTDAYRRSLWIRRPDTGWWVLFLDTQKYRGLSLKGRWEWLP